MGRPRQVRDALVDIGLRDVSRGPPRVIVDNGSGEFGGEPLNLREQRQRSQCHEVKFVELPAAGNVRGGLFLEWMLLGHGLTSSLASGRTGKRRAAPSDLQ